MSSNADDADDEYLDDPISLMTIYDIKKEICDKEIIDIQTSSDEEEIYTSSYGKKNLVLPVTFFDNTRNIRLLNKCKPMSISIVDCKQFPTFYGNRRERKKNNSNCDDISVEIDNILICNKYSDNVNKPSSADAQNVVTNTSITVHEADKKLEGEKKRRGPKSDSFYEKLKRRKENSKQTALNCKDLSQVNFKQNTGLVGLKITDTIFKQIVNTEKALIRTKKHSIESKFKDSNDTDAEKLLITKSNDSPEVKCKNTFEKEVLSAGSGENSIENKHNDTVKGSDVAKNIDSTKDKFKEKSESAMDKASVGNQCKINILKDSVKTLNRTSISSVKDKCKEERESNIYVKEVGVTLNNFGTTIIPVTNTHTNNGAYKNIKTYKNKAAATGKLRNHQDIEMRCSLKIPSEKIVEKVLKLKEVQSYNNNSSNVSINAIVQQSPKETMAKSQTVPNLNNLRKYNIDGSYVVPKKDKLQSSTYIAYSPEPKEVKKPVAKYTSNKDRPGSNSPVIPCTTITVRASSSKSAQSVSSSKLADQSSKQDNSTVQITPSTNCQKNSLPPINIIETKNTSNDAQKLSELPKVSTVNQVDFSNNSRYQDTSKQLTVISQTNFKAVSDTKHTSICTQNSTSNLTILKITEPNNYPFATRLMDIKNNILAPNLTDQNMSKTNLTKEGSQVNTPIKSATYSGNTNQTTNDLIKNQTYPNQHMSPSSNPKFSGHNAIIFRRPPLRDFSNNAPNQGQPIQTVINHRPPQYQPTPHGSMPMRFRFPPPYPPPPPNYQLSPPNYSSPPSNLAQLRPNHLFIPPSKTTSVYFRGINMGLNHLRFPGPRPGCSPLPDPPRQDLQMNHDPQVNKGSFIGNTANGDPIKKINLPPVATATLNDKQMMLAELNSAMMSPDLSNKPEKEPCDLKRKADPKRIESNDLKRKAGPKRIESNDLKRKADPILMEPVKPKHSKPCPLSKKVNEATDLNKEVPDKRSPDVGYSPPILPIWTYEQSFEIFAKNDANIKKAVSNNMQNRTPTKTTCKASILKLGSKKQKRTRTDCEKHDKAKKISFDDYRRRAKDGFNRIDVDKIRKYNESKNVTDDYNQDLGYASDSTVKL